MQINTQLYNFHPTKTISNSSYDIHTINEKEWCRGHDSELCDLLVKLSCYLSIFGDRWKGLKQTSKVHALY